MHSKNLTLLTVLYELTMMQGYYDKQDNPTVIFDVFYRSNPFSSGYAIAAGLEQVIEYVKNLNFSYDDVDYLRSLHIFSEDFLQYLSGYHFTGSISGRKPDLPKGADPQSRCPDHGSSACGNRNPEHSEPPVSDRDQVFPYRIRCR